MVVLLNEIVFVLIILIRMVIRVNIGSVYKLYIYLINYV